MSTKGFSFGLILLVVLASVVTSSCLCSISCPCGSNSDKIYTQCNNNSFHEKYTCERWANCLTCEAKTNYCITCPPGRYGPTCAEGAPPLGTSSVCPHPTVDPNGDMGEIFPADSRQKGQGFEAGSQVSFTCKSGYEMRGINTIFCLINGQWSNDPPTCKRISVSHPTANCPDPGSIQNGYRRLVEGYPSRLSRFYSNGQTFQYACNEGYQLLGNNQLTCLISGKWSNNTPRCQRIPRDPSPYCLDPGQITYGSYRNSPGDSRTSQRYAVGESVIYYCQNGYELVGKEMITCTDSGSWPMRPICRRVTASKPPNLADGTFICPDPGSIHNGYRRLTNGVTSKETEMYKIGQTFEYFCNAGYELRGENVLTCSNSGRWTNNKPWCQSLGTGTSPSGTLAGCPYPNVDPNGGMEEIYPADPRQKGQGFEAGSQVSFTCKSGYEMRGANTITCLINGQWTSDPPTCTRISVMITPPSVTPTVCPIPVVDPNVEMEEVFPIDPRQKRRGFESGSQVSFTCINGYELQGADTITCLRNGQWTSHPPTCIKISDDTTSQPFEIPIVCPDPDVDPNGKMEEVYSIDSRNAGQGFEAGSQVIFTCNSGYEMVGINTLTCLRTGRWTSEPPTCSSISDDMDCGRSKLPTGSKITHGRVVNEGEFPWIVLVSTNKSTAVAGILLDHTTVLTSAHPLEHERQCKLYFFKLNRTTNSIDDRFVETRWSSRIILHPEYNSKTQENDLAIVKFSTDIPYSVNIEPICAPTLQSSARNIVPGQTGYLVGWGFTKENQEEVNPNLMVAPLPIKATQTCQRGIQKLDPLLKITSGMFCAGVPDAEKRNDVCSEGVGGALVFYNTQINRFTVEGIASHRPPGRCYDPGNNIIFTKVSNYVEWIMQYLGK